MSSQISKASHRSQRARNNECLRNHQMHRAHKNSKRFLKTISQAVTTSASEEQLAVCVHKAQSTEYLEERNEILLRAGWDGVFLSELVVWFVGSYCMFPCRKSLYRQLPMDTIIVVWIRCTIGVFACALSIWDAHLGLVRESPNCSSHLDRKDNQQEEEELWGQTTSVKHHGW